MNCDRCGEPMKELFTSVYCDCPQGETLTLWLSSNGIREALISSRKNIFETRFVVMNKTKSPEYPYYITLTNCIPIKETYIDEKPLYKRGATITDSNHPAILEQISNN